MGCKIRIELSEMSVDILSWNLICVGGITNIDDGLNHEVRGSYHAIAMLVSTLATHLLPLSGNASENRVE